MNPQINQQMTQGLQQDWTNVCHSILDRFTTVTKADLDAARDADDLIHRISSKSQFSPDYVETQIGELVGAGAPIQYQQQQQFNAPQQQQGQQAQQGQQRRNRGGRRGSSWANSGDRPLGTYSS